MTEPNNHTLTDNQNEQTLTFLRNEIDSLKFQLKKKEDRIADLDAFVKLSSAAVFHPFCPKSRNRSSIVSKS